MTEVPLYRNSPPTHSQGSHGAFGDPLHEWFLVHMYVHAFDRETETPVIYLWWDVMTSRVGWPSYTRDAPSSPRQTLMPVTPMPPEQRCTPPVVWVGNSVGNSDVLRNSVW
jgi:hypothetical protein